MINTDLITTTNIKLLAENKRLTNQVKAIRRQARLKNAVVIRFFDEVRKQGGVRLIELERLKRAFINTR